MNTDPYTAVMNEQEARIRELDDELYRVREELKYSDERIERAKAILTRCNYNITDDPNVSDALAALEGK